ncbi:MAG: class I adenylate-forming enzyme family protein [Sulfitobacter sp.]
MIPNHLFLYQHLERSAADFPDKMAAQDTQTTLSYSALHQSASAIAHKLVENGVKPGDRVILYLSNSVEFVQAFWGAVYAGAAVTPLSIETKPKKLAWIISDCTPAAIIAQGDQLDVLDVIHDQEINPFVLSMDEKITLDETADIPCKGKTIDQDLGCIVYTSGSTGNPKGVMLSHQNLTAASRSVCTYLGYRNDDTLFVAVPLTFDYGMHQLTMAALVGASVIVETNFSSSLYALHRLATSGATVFPIVPTMAPLIFSLADRFDFSSVRLVSSTAAALHTKVIDQLGDVFTSATIFSMYGLTECHRCTYVPPADLERKKGSVGVAIPNTEMWVTDSNGDIHTSDATGELVIRGATVMKGYWNNPEKTLQRLKPGRFPGEFVLYTGDLCRIDADGYLYFLSRSDDVLKIRGEKVAPKEVEDVLLSHQAVSEAIVFGKPDAIQGQVVHACITLVQGAQISVDELRNWCQTHLASISVPKSIVVHEKFMRNANGKIDRTALIDQQV